MFLGAHQAQYINLAAARHFQVHPMFQAYLDPALPRLNGRSR
jgi:hypothetical protein